MQAARTYFDKIPGWGYVNRFHHGAGYVLQSVAAIRFAGIRQEIKGQRCVDGARARLGRQSVQFQDFVVERLGSR